MAREYITRIDLNIDLSNVYWSGDALGMVSF